MTVEIRAPDGSIVNFPDGTSDDVIVKVMRENFPPDPAMENWPAGAPKPAPGQRVPEMRAHEPTWRDRLGQMLMPDERASPMREKVVEGLVGSRGLGPTGINAADFVPPIGIPLAADEAQRAAEKGNWGQAALHSLAAIPAPGVGPAAKVAQKAAPGIAAEASQAVDDAARAAPAAVTPPAQAAAAAPPQGAPSAAAAPARDIATVRAEYAEAREKADKARIDGLRLSQEWHGREHAMPERLAIEDAMRREQGGAAQYRAEILRRELESLERAAPPAAPSTPPASGVAPPSARAPQVSAGIPDRIVTPDGSMEVAAKPELVELDKLKLAGGALQPRDRSRAEYIQGARERASRLDPQQLMPNRVSDTGSPIVLEDGTIISGNGRVLSISEVYNNPALAPQAEAYRKALGPEAAKMKRPVLVMRAEKLPPEDLQRFGDLSNRGRVASMSATERAARDAKAVGPEDLALYQGGDFDAPQNVGFMQAFQRKAVPANELPAFSRDGALTQEGIQRMRSAVLASAFDDAPTLSRLLESADDNVRGISGAMADVAPAIARLRADIGSGQVMPHLDPAKSIQQAARLIADLRSRGVPLGTHFAQQDAFNAVPKDVEAWVRALYSPDLGNQLSRPQMAALMRAYTDEAGKHAPGGLFPDHTTNMDVLEVARRAIGATDNAVAPAAAPGAAAAAGAPPPAAPPPAAAAGGAGRSGGGGGGDIGLPPEMARNTPIPGKLPAGILDGPGPAVRATRDEAIDAAERLGVSIPKVAASDSLLTKQLGGVIKEMPGVGKPIVQSIRTSIHGLEDKTAEIAQKYGPSATYSVGDAIGASVKEWIDNGSDEVLKRLYTNVGKQLDKSKPSAMPATRKAVQALEKEIQESTSEVNKKAIDLVSEALKRPQGLTYDGMIKLRSDIGARLSGSIIPEPGTPMPALKRIYGALNQDLQTFVYQNGNRGVFEAWRKAERVAQTVHDRREALAKVVGEKAGVAPERIVDRIVKMAQEGGGGDVVRLLQIRKAVGPEVWDGIPASVVRELGQNRDGVFSPAIFLGGYEKMSNAGKNVLFGSTGKSELRQALDDIATVSAKIKSVEQFANPSGTGRVASYLAAGGGLYTMFWPAITGALGSHVIAQVLARPATAKATARLLKMAGEGYQSPSLMSPGRAAAMAVAVRNLAHEIAREFDADEREIDGALKDALGLVGSGIERVLQ